MKNAFDTFWDEQQKFILNTIPDDAMSIGTVISLSPLKIKIDDLQLTENNFSINPYLLEYTEEVNMTTTTNGEPPHSHQIISITHPTKLKLYSKVLCYGSGYDHYSGYQYYYVLEVVS